MMTELEEQNQIQDEGSKGTRWGMVLAWVIMLGLLAIVALRLLKTQQGTVGQGEAAPNFTLTTFEGEEIGSAEMQGKVVLVNFWASWCRPCEQEAAELQTAWEMYEPSGEVLFLGVDFADTETEALAYMEKFGITYPSGPDLGTRISQAFRTSGVPETYFIDKDGMLSFVKIGPFESLEEITSKLDTLLVE